MRAAAERGLDLARNIFNGYREVMQSIVTIIGSIVVLIFLLWLYFVVPWQMTERRNRNTWVWVAISVVGSPLLAILLLYALGDAPNTI